VTGWDPQLICTDILGLALRGNSVYAGGFLVAVGDQERHGFAEIDAASGYATPLIEEAAEPVSAFALSGSTLYMGGAFSCIGLSAQSHFAALRWDTPTPVLVSLASATAFPDRIELAWRAEGAGITRFRVQRRGSAGDWVDIGSVSADGTGLISFVDRGVTPGARYAYRLGYEDGGARLFTTESWVDVPAALALALAGARPNPSAGRLTVSFTLPSARAATLELLDVTGRRLVSHSVGSLGAGAHVLDLSPSYALRAGLYWLRLTQSGRVLTAKAVVTR